MRKHVELNITWALGLDQRLLIVQTVASILGSTTAPLLFLGGGGRVQCPLHKTDHERPEMKSGAEGHDGV